MIYFIQDKESHYIKIGFTAGSADSRMRALQTGNPTQLSILHTMEGNIDDERKLHAKFADFRHVGEWFRPAPPLLEFLMSIAKLPIVKEVPQVVKKNWPLKFYLAGKITESDWRQSIIGRVSIDDECPYGLHLKELAEWPETQFCILDSHSFVGPYFISCGHGCYQGEDQHGVGAQRANDHDSPDRCKQTVDYCLKAIKACDIFFAWIDQLDCYGTITELGYAKAMGKQVWVAGPKKFRDMWFVYEMADLQTFGPGRAAGYLEDLLDEHLGYSKNHIIGNGIVPNSNS